MKPNFPQRYHVYTCRTNVVLATDDLTAAIRELRSLPWTDPTEEPWIWDSLMCSRLYLERSVGMPLGRAERPIDIPAKTEGNT